MLAEKLPLHPGTLAVAAGLVLTLLVAEASAAAVPGESGRGEAKFDGDVVAVYTPVASPRGRRPNKSFLDPSDIDSIDTSTGNLTVRIPFGQRYQVGPLISYRLQVVHNSNIWDNVTIRCTAAQGGGSACDLVPTNFSIPNIGSNAGVGWEFHLGKLFAPPKGGNAPVGLDDIQLQRMPTWDGDENDQFDDSNTWLYIAPDGARHRLYFLDGRFNSHDGFPVRYSKDATFLRMRQIDASTIHVNHPDGRISIFQKTDQPAGTDFCGNGITGCWRLERITDPWGNFVRIVYTRDFDLLTETWRILDSAGREHRAVFSIDPLQTGGRDGIEPFATDDGDEWGDLRRVLTQVDLAAFGNERAPYDLSYAVQPVRRGCAHEYPLFHSLTAPVLQQISVPHSQPWVFDTRVQGQGCGTSAKLGKVTAPSQAAVSYTYGIWRHPTRCTYQNVSDPNDVEYTYETWGIRSRTTHLATGLTEGTRTYSNHLEPLISEQVLFGQDCSRARTRITTVDQPSVGGKHRRDRYFHSVTQVPFRPSKTTPDTEFQITDHGLPIKKDARTGGVGNFRFLSHQVQECSAGSCANLRETYLRYTSQYRDRCNEKVGDLAGCWQIDAVPVREWTVYRDDGNKIRETVRLGYNGAGKFQERRLRDRFAPGNVLHTTREITEYTATGGITLGIDPTTGYLRAGDPWTYLPTPDAPWILHPHTSKRWIENGAEYRVDYEFDAGGALRCLRRRQSPAAWGPRDLVVSIGRGTVVGKDAGLPVTETFAGGETATLGTAELCDVIGSVADGSRYVFEHDYDFYTLKSSRHQEDVAGLFLYRARIDRNTGLESAIWNTADQRTDLAYDRLGRLLTETPEASLKQASTLIEYRNNPGARPLIVTDKKHGGSRLLRQIVWEDGFGRTHRERRRLPEPGGGFVRSDRVSHYDALGRRVRQTTWQDSTVLDLDKATLTTDHDVFGRPGMVTRPDGKTERFAYQGDRLTTREVDVRTSLAAETAAATTTERDARGRIVRLTTPLHDTTFRYDVFGARTAATRGGGGLAQTRSWTWDARGLLLAEQLPELGTAGGGRRDFQPDALGNVRRAWGSGPDLSFLYDTGARLTGIWENGANRWWESRFYGAANAGNSFGKGKLIRADRHNYFPNGGHWVVREDYAYRGELGQLSTKIVQAQDAATPFTDAAFEVQFGYDPLGRRDWIRYPTCIPTPGTSEQRCADGPNDRLAPERIFSSVSVEGRLTSATSRRGGLTDVSADYTYHPNGQLASIRFGNTVDTVFDQGSLGMPRPQRIRVKKGAAVLWDTGSYGYDGAGNIWAVGSDRYLYDSNSRLISGSFSATGIPHSETYAYDAADNMIGFTRDGGNPISLVVDGSSNRLLRDGTGSPVLSSLAYDDAGQLTSAGRNPFFQPIFRMGYDAFGLQSSFEQDGDGLVGPELSSLYVYGPGNFRLIEADALTGERSYTLRDMEGQPLREFQVSGWGNYTSAASPGARWLHTKDYVAADGSAVASVDHLGSVHYLHKDHLGSTRLITDDAGSVRGRHFYYPYGRRVSPGIQVHEPTIGFTGHERDTNSFSIYMLGRTYLEPFFRFANPDPARDGWNLYGYVGGNPIRFVDRTGLSFGVKCDACGSPGDDVGKAFEKLRQIQSQRTPAQVKAEAGIFLFTGKIAAAIGLSPLAVRKKSPGALITKVVAAALKRAEQAAEAGLDDPAMVTMAAAEGAAEGMLANTLSTGQSATNREGASSVLLGVVVSETESGVEMMADAIHERREQEQMSSEELETNLDPEKR
ncbi:MAG: RHS repeat-associated core domain-containing protein [Holophagales bacterium]|nr:RHS repeat-associated core domain-containing protein [Holophagales bacterium]